MDPHTQAPDTGTTPGRRSPHPAWIGMCVALILALGVIVMAAHPLAITSAAPTTTFNAEERVTVTVDPADTPLIYASATRPGRAHCAVAGGPSPDALALTAPDDERSVEIDGVTWQPLFEIKAPAPGAYHVRCTAETDARFGVGTALGPGASPVLRLLCFAGTGALSATLVSLLKRRRAARRGN